MVKSMKKVKVLTGSLAAFVLGIGFNQEACGSRGSSVWARATQQFDTVNNGANPVAAPNRFSPYTLRTTNEDSRVISVYDQVLNGNPNLQVAEQNAVSVFNNATTGSGETIRHLIERRRGNLPAPTRINVGDHEAFRHALLHSVGRHLFHMDGNNVTNDETPTSFFFLNGDEANRLDNICSIINMLDVNRGIIIRSNFGEHTYGDHTSYAMIDVRVPRINAERTGRRTWSIPPTQEPVIGSATIPAGDDRAEEITSNFASVDIRYLLVNTPRGYRWIVAASMWPTMN